MPDEPRWCCQGAEECDGIRWNAEARQFEFVLYLSTSDDGELQLVTVWHKAVACPLCGATIPVFPQPCGFEVVDG